MFIKKCNNCRDVATIDFIALTDIPNVSDCRYDPQLYSCCNACFLHKTIIITNRLCVRKEKYLAYILYLWKEAFQHLYCICGSPQFRHFTGCDENSGRNGTLGSASLLHKIVIARDPETQPTRRGAFLQNMHVLICIIAVIIVNLIIVKIL